MSIRSICTPKFQGLKTFVRHGGGGGGRPGNVPVFNWKQQKALGIKAPIQGRKFKVGLFGNITDLLKHHPIDESRGDFKVKFNEVADWEEPGIPTAQEWVQQHNWKRKVNVQSLFGSTKAFGLHPWKANARKIVRYFPKSVASQ